MKQSINTMLTRSFVKYNVFLVILLLPFLSLKAQTPNERQARRIFNHTYDMVFGDKGSSLSYNVNIIRIYKTSGKIWMKGKKSVFEEERYIGYTNEKYYYRVDQKANVHRKELVFLLLFELNSIYPESTVQHLHINL